MLHIKAAVSQHHDNKLSTHTYSPNMKFALICFVASLMVLGTMVSAAEEQAPTEECPRICPLHYAPLCGKNSKGETHTFSNSCEMRAKNCNGKNDYVQEKTGQC